MIRITQYQPPPPLSHTHTHTHNIYFFFFGDNFQSQILKWEDQKKMSEWGDSNNSSHKYLPGGKGLTMFLVKKDFAK